MDTPLWARIAAVVVIVHVVRTFAPWALSELLFLCLCVWFLHTLETGGSLWRLIPLAALASLVRYVGVILILTGVIVLAWRREWRRVMWFGLLAGLPLLVWMGRNLVLTDTLMGVRVESPFEFSAVVGAYIRVVVGWTVEAGVIFGSCYVVDRVWHSLQRVHDRERVDYEI
jgi:hypothetical protein